ncbi:cyclin-dependent kinase inhibitor 5-like [Curcuma longa]|uniref:cyclin-dependent kinase inhibitor 5-like n=1 Tax=Curcuma longa TaxID=136217 RepID=UPI003D9F3A41
MEVSHHRAAHGVRTRARTLAADSSLAYLELRSRRLAKPSLVSVDPCEGSTKSHHSGPTSWQRAARNLRKDSEPVITFDEDEEVGEATVVEVDHFDVEATERHIRETTPCGSIKRPDMITTPGSTTRPTTSSVNNQRRHTTISQHIPTQQDLEEFFGNTEQHHQQSLQEKYNFDFVNENPLPGRYEWVIPDFF